MSTGTRIPLAQALDIAGGLIQQLEPHCEVISTAGSIRRMRPTIGDVEIVCVPRPGIATVVSQWPKVRGELPCTHTRRELPEMIHLDLFMVHPDGYGLQRAIRTGSADWCRQVLAPAWVKAGFRSEGGLLRRVVHHPGGGSFSLGEVVPVRTEPELFGLIGLAWVAPRDREVTA
jgi:DNA polymerase (family 10)